MDNESKELLRKILKTNKKILDLLEKNSLFANKPTDKDKVVVYVDGSYNNNFKIGTYGIVLFNNDGKKTYSGKVKQTFSEALTSTICECFAVVMAIGIVLSAKAKAKEVVIKYDCTSIVDFLEIPEQNRKPTQRWYCNFITKARKKINITFVKIKAHSDNEYNQEADLLAKSCLRTLVKQAEAKKKK